MLLLRSTSFLSLAEVVSFPKIIETILVEKKSDLQQKLNFHCIPKPFCNRPFIIFNPHLSLLMYGDVVKHRGKNLFSSLLINHL